MKRSILVTSGFAALLGIFGLYGFGHNLPETHELTLQATYQQPVELVWEALTDYPNFPGWSSRITKVESQGEEEGLPVWRFTLQDGHYMDIQVSEEEKEQFLLHRIVETDGEFAGSWAFSLRKEKKDTTQLTLKEEGEIESPVARLALYFSGKKEASAYKYLSELGRKFGEKPEITTVQP